MIQKRYYPPYQYRPPQKFIPRRDLFPDAVVPQEAVIPLDMEPSKPPTLVSSPQSHVQNSNNVPVNALSKKRYSGDRSPMISVKSGKKRAIPQETLLLVFAGLLLMGPKLKKLGLIGDPRSLDMLLSLGPYLNEKEQDAVYTAAGVLEAFHTINDVMSHTYHNRHKAMSMQVPSSPSARKIEAMKAIKPYIKPDTRQQLDRFVNLYETMNKLRSNITIYRNNRSLSGKDRLSTFESVNEVLKVIKPILPEEHRERADKAVQLFKMAEAISSAEKLSKGAPKDKSGKRYDRKETVNTVNKDNASDSEDQNEKIQKMMDSLSPMLNDEQKESINMIMKMAQLLSQSDSSEDNTHEEK